MRAPEASGRVGGGPRLRQTPPSPPTNSTSLLSSMPTSFVDFMRKGTRTVKARSLALLAVAIAVALVAPACGGGGDTAGGGSSPLVAAPCGGADDPAGGGSSGSSSVSGGANAQLSLVAYSTPQVV